MLRKGLKIGLMGIGVTLLASPAFARSIELKGAGTALWVFLAIGTIIVLLQLIPAGILFFSFVGSATGAVFKKEKRVEEWAIPASEPTPVEK